MLSCLLLRRSIDDADISRILLILRPFVLCDTPSNIPEGRLQCEDNCSSSLAALCLLKASVCTMIRCTEDLPRWLVLFAGNEPAQLLDEATAYA